jgi:hypothetical protein
MTELDTQTTTKAPRLALLLIFIAISAWMIGALYTWFFDPEMKFWTQAAKQKLAWVEEVRAKHGYVIGVVGGSTTTFGIDAEYIEREHGLPVANLGLHVGMGPEALVGFGLSSLRKGDTLVLSLEPSILTEEYAETFKLGSKLSLILGRPEMLGWDQEVQVLPILKALAALPPGGYHAMTMMGKLAMRMPPYRYSIENLQPGGLQVTAARSNFAAGMDFSSPEKVPPLSEHGVQLLRSAQSAADERGINLIYVLPWSYWPQETVNERRTTNAALLKTIGRHVPVLVEPSMGAHSELKDFADSGQHLTAKAAAARSSVLAETLKADRESRDHQNNPHE